MGQNILPFCQRLGCRSVFLCELIQVFLQVFSGFFHQSWICPNTVRYRPVKRNASFFDANMVGDTVLPMGEKSGPLTFSF